MKKITFLFFAVVFMLSVKAQTVYQTYVVTGNETWDLTNHPNGVDILEKIVIEDGGTLNINDIALRFEPANVWTGSIELKTGGKLFAINVSFTNRTPNSAWHGIRVRGNPAVPYYNLPQQGFLVIDSCFFKGAKYAILGSNGDGNQLLAGTGGGTVVVRNSFFQDCSPSIAVTQAPLGLTLIRGSSFVTTNNYSLYNFHNPNSAPIAIHSLRTTTRISSCTFEENRPFPLKGKPKIIADGGDVRVWNCYFNIVNEGLTSRSIDPTDKLFVHDNIFKVQTEGVFLAWQTNSVILRNEIELVYPFSGMAGIILHESNNFTIEENIVKAPAWYNHANIEQFHGIYAYRTGLYNNEIYNNTIDKLWYGISALGNLVDDDHGLLIKCNKLTNNRFDIFAWSGPAGEGIYKYQGSMANHPNAPAGNLFSWHGWPAFDFVNNNYSEHVYYVHHHESGLRHVPQIYTNLSITLNPNMGGNAQYHPDLTCPSNFPPGGGLEPGDPNNPATRLAAIIEANDAATEVENLIAQLKDAGNTPVLVSNVNWQHPARGLCHLP